MILFAETTWPEAVAVAVLFVCMAAVIIAYEFRRYRD